MFRRRSSSRESQPPLSEERGEEDRQDLFPDDDPDLPPLEAVHAAAEPEPEPEPEPQPPLRPLARTRPVPVPGPAAMSTSSSSTPTGFRPDIARRLSDLPGIASRRRPGEVGGDAQAREPERILSVGRDISLSGEINACDQLVVEGEIQAKLNECRVITVSPGGVFRGSADVEDADIGGLFDGDLVVRNRLKLRSGGRVSGTLRYGELEVEAGGKIVGTVQPIEAEEPTAEAATVTSLPDPGDRDA